MVDVNQPLSRGFCISLRFLQLGLQLLVAQLISKISNTDCSQTLVTIGLPISYIILGLNLIAILVIRCKQWFNRKVFFVFYAVNVILAGVVMIVGFGGIGQANSCAGNRVANRYCGFQALVGIVVTTIALFGEFDWALRYTNAPGNLAWPFMFFAYTWTQAFQGSYITVGILTLLTSLATFIVNIITLKTGLTTSIRRVIQVQWIAALIVMGICQIIVFATYLGGANNNQFNDSVAKKLAQTYLPINFIDAVFWVWGLLTLKYTSGDVVREGIMGGDPLDDNDLDHQGKPGFGTLKK